MCICLTSNVSVAMDYISTWLGDLLGPDSRKVSSLSQISAALLLKSEIIVSAEILLKLRLMKGISAETKISAKF